MLGIVFFDQGIKDCDRCRRHLVAYLGRAEVHLKRAQHVVCLFIKLSGHVDTVAVGFKSSLDVSNRHWLLYELLPVTYDGLVVVPGAVTKAVQALPGETRARIDFSIGGNVCMADDVRRPNVRVTLEYLAQQID